ncbi:MAG TPA: orotidine-5'-phosphate decarboxylase [Clostridia bacterium]
MNSFADRLIDAVARLDNPTVLGLDPMLEYIPDDLLAQAAAGSPTPAGAAAKAIFAFNRRLIDAVADIIPAVKLQSAYYELYGHHGVEAFALTAEYAQSRGLLAIADCKRNDIGSTAEAYATAYLGRTRFPEGFSTAMFDMDAITVNPYLGIDGVEPFVRLCEQEGKGIFILVRTSNPSAVDFQDLHLDSGESLYERVADRVTVWGRGLVGRSGYSSVGAVVGATWPDQAMHLRERMPGVLFLVPGYGTQGATAADVCASFDADGRGAIVNASRSLMCAYRRVEGGTKDGFEEACRTEALHMRDDIRTALDQCGKIRHMRPEGS